MPQNSQSHFSAVGSTEITRSVTEMLPQYTIISVASYQSQITIKITCIAHVVKKFLER